MLRWQKTVILTRIAWWWCGGDVDTETKRIVEHLFHIIFWHCLCPVHVIRTKGFINNIGLEDGLWCRDRKLVFGPEWGRCSWRHFVVMILRSLIQDWIARMGLCSALKSEMVFFDIKAIWLIIKLVTEFMPRRVSRVLSTPFRHHYILWFPNMRIGQGECIRNLLPV